MSSIYTARRILYELSGHKPSFFKRGMCYIKDYVKWAKENNENVKFLFSKEAIENAKKYLEELSKQSDVYSKEDIAEIRMYLLYVYIPISLDIDFNNMSDEKAISLINTLYKAFSDNMHACASILELFKKIKKKYSLSITTDQTLLVRKWNLFCPHCGTQTRLVRSEVIYGKTYGGHRYLCPKCHTHVGTHKGTNIPLGLPANAKEQKYRKKLHDAFDPLWRKEKSIFGGNRTRAYEWLSKTLNKKEVHIADMSVEDCELALEAIENLITKIHLS